MTVSHIKQDKTVDQDSFLIVHYMITHFKKFFVSTLCLIPVKRFTGTWDENLNWSSVFIIIGKNPSG